MSKLKTDIFKCEPKETVEKTKRIICTLQNAEGFPNDLSCYLDTYQLDKIRDDTNAVIKESSVDKLKIVKRLSKFWLGVSLFANDFNNSDDINQSSLDIKSSFSDLVTAIEKTVLNSDSNILPFIQNLNNSYYLNKDVSTLLNECKCQAKMSKNAHLKCTITERINHRYHRRYFYP